MSFQNCVRCLRSKAGPSALTYHAHRVAWKSYSASTEASAKSQDPTSSSSKSQISEIEAVRARAWYLDDPAPSSSTSSTDTPRPRFTTFDPDRSHPLEETDIIIHPLPSSAPASLVPLHTFLTHDADDVIDPSSVIFYDTREAIKSVRSVGEDIPTRPGQGRRGRRGFALGLGMEAAKAGVEGSEEMIWVGDGVGARWNWVIVLRVRGRGKGVVGRAERVVRQWLHENPLDGSGPPRIKYPKHPSPPAETDWSLIDVGKGSGICINLFTAEGGERWALEDVWGSTSENGRLGAGE